MKHQFEVGQAVIYRPDFGTGPETRVVIIGLGEKNDKPVYDLNNGRWCYEESIVKEVRSRKTDPMDFVVSEPAAEEQPTNVISMFRWTPKKQKTEAVSSFAETMRKNKENQERLKKDRAKNNQSVTRSYGLNTNNNK